MRPSPGFGGHIRYVQDSLREQRDYFADAIHSLGSGANALIDKQIEVLAQEYLDMQAIASALESTALNVTPEPLLGKLPTLSAIGA